MSSFKFYMRIQIVGFLLRNYWIINYLTNFKLQISNSKYRVLAKERKLKLSPKKISITEQKNRTIEGGTGNTPSPPQKKTKQNKTKKTRETKSWSTLQCLKALQWNSWASSDKLQQAGSHLIIKVVHSPPEPAHYVRLGCAVLEARVFLPVIQVYLTQATNHQLQRKEVVYKNMKVKAHKSQGYAEFYIALHMIGPWSKCFNHLLSLFKAVIFFLFFLLRIFAILDFTWPSTLKFKTPFKLIRLGKQIMRRGYWTQFVYRG